jgi:1,4-alpha-glucan branching enzyme
MIRTRRLSKDDKIEVTFSVPAPEEAGRMSVVGDFNQWDAGATPLRKRKDSRSAKVTVDAGRRYAFRYLREDGEWLNDEEAHDYEPGPFGGVNSVVDLNR